MDQLWPVIGPGTGWAAFLLLAFLVLRAIVKGDLIPRSTHDEKIHEANEWRAESRIKDAQIAEKDRQLAHMGEVGRLMKAVLAAIQSRTGIRVEDEGT